MRLKLDISYGIKPKNATLQAPFCKSMAPMFLFILFE